MKHLFVGELLIQTRPSNAKTVQVFKKLGDAGLLGVNKPVEYGGMGLDFK